MCTVDILSGQTLLIVENSNLAGVFSLAVDQLRGTLYGFYIDVNENFTSMMITNVDTCKDYYNWSCNRWLQNFVYSWYIHPSLPNLGVIQLDKYDVVHNVSLSNKTSYAFYEYQTQHTYFAEFFMINMETGQSKLMPIGEATGMHTAVLWGMAKMISVLIWIEVHLSY